MDPIEQLGNEQLRELSYDLLVQLEKGTGTRPLLWILAQSRTRAAIALQAFINADPTEASVIRTLQGEVKVYNDMVALARELVALGRAADHQITEDGRIALQDIVLDMSDDDRRLYQLQERGTD